MFSPELLMLESDLASGLLLIANIGFVLGVLAARAWYRGAATDE